MTALVPSRADENYRYTQIDLGPTGAADWSRETLTLNDQKFASVPFSTAAKDFYLPVIPEHAPCDLVDLSKKNPDSEGWHIIQSRTSGEKALGLYQLNVSAGENFRVLEHLRGESALGLFVRNIRVARGAKLELFVLQEEIPTSQTVIRHFVEVEEGAECMIRFFHVGAAKGQHRISARIAQNAEFHIEGACLLKDQQHMDIWAETEHIGGAGISRTTVWNVLTDQSSAVFNGMIRILKNCPKIEGYQSNKSLLLSEKAKVFTLPKLEIATDDVKCSHGASVATLDPAQLFYLESRGINKKAAESMLIHAFTEPVLRHLPKRFSMKWMEVQDEL